LKIGIYSGEWRPGSGGGFTFQHELVNEITKANSRHDIFIIGGRRGELSPGGARYISLADYRGNLLPRLVNKAVKIATRGFADKKLFEAALDRALKKNNIELVWFVSTAAAKVTVPYIVTVWDLAHRVHPYFPEVSVTGWSWDTRENHYRALLPRAAGIITGTQAGKEEIIKYYQVPDHLVKVVPFPTPSFVLPANDQLTTANKELKLPERYLFYPAQFWPHKNHVNLLLAMKILSDKYGMDLKLVLTGADRGNLDYVRKKIMELNIDDRVIILGFVDKDVLTGLYRNAFALVFPTFLGPDNLPPLEAFALGCPVVASEVSGAQEQLGDAAILFDPKNPEDIAHKIKTLYYDPAKREHLIRKGRLRAESWTMRDYVNRVLTFVDEFEPVRRCWSPEKVYIHK